MAKCPMITEVGAPCQGNASKLTGVCAAHGKNPENWTTLPKKENAAKAKMAKKASSTSKTNLVGVYEPKKVQAFEYTCDSCGKMFLEAEEAWDPVLGYHGSVYYHHEYGGDAVGFFICNDCVKDHNVDVGISQAFDRQRHPESPFRGGK